jgi:ABC-type multidrug transport system, ATPase component
MPLLEVQDFGKRYRGKRAVSGVDFSVERGELFGLIGPDGAGKSSLMKAVAGVLAYEEGRIVAFGVPVDSERNAERVKGRMGFMPQGLGLNLYPELSVEENIDFFARLREVPPAELRERKARLLAMTRLAPFRGRAMKKLSGGMKQKLGLVCTLIHQPELVILDEPTTGVDPLSRRDFWAILAELLNEQGISALVSTAYLDEASRFHRLALMHQGRVLDQGTPEEILSRVPGSVVQFRSRVVAEVVARLRDRFPQVESYGSRVRLFLPGVAPEVASREVTAQLQGVEMEELEALKPELEDAFIQLLEEQSEKRGSDFSPTVGSGAPAATFGLGGPAAGESETDSRRPDRPRSGRLRQRPEGEEVMIEARELVRDFGRFRAVDHVSFRVRRGEIFGLLGANGAGKTTVIKMLTGLLPPTGGEGRVAGADMRTSSRAIRQRIGYMSQAFSLYRDMTVLENIRLYGGIYGLHGKALKARTAWVLAMAGLGGQEREMAGSLPMGLRQRLALGCALVHRPRVLFLDEPTSGVDPLGRRRFWEILTWLSRSEAVTILITTHYMSEAEHCDRLALMHAGRLVADQPPEALRRELVAEAGELLELEVDRPLAALECLKAHFAGVSLHGNRIHLFARDPEAARRRIGDLLAGAGLELRGLRRRVPGMEDVFVYRMGALEAAA